MFFHLLNLYYYITCESSSQGSYITCSSTSQWKSRGVKPPRVVGSIPTWSHARSKDRVTILSTEIVAADIPETFKVSSSALIQYKTKVFRISQECLVECHSLYALAIAKMPPAKREKALATT